MKQLEKLQIMTSSQKDEEGKDVSFYGLELLTFSCERQRTGSRTITATLKHPVCLDDYWTGKEYVIFRGERYILHQTPTWVKDNTDTRYVYSLEFRSEMDIALSGTYLIDAVSDDVNAPQTNTTTLRFGGTLEGFVKRLNVCLRNQKLPYSVSVEAEYRDNGEKATESIFIDFVDQTIIQVIQKAAQKDGGWGVPYYYDGDMIVFGYGLEKGKINDLTLKYGAKDSLIKIQKQNSGDSIITRITGYGSSENVPYFYPNQSPKGDLRARYNGREIPIVNQWNFSDVNGSLRYTGGNGVVTSGLFFESGGKRTALKVDASGSGRCTAQLETGSRGNCTFRLTYNLNVDAESDKPITLKCYFAAALDKIYANIADVGMTEEEYANYTLNNLPSMQMLTITPELRAAAKGASFLDISSVTIGGKNVSFDMGETTVYFDEGAFEGSQFDSTMTVTITPAEMLQAGTYEIVVTGIVDTNPKVVLPAGTYNCPAFVGHSVVSNDDVVAQGILDPSSLFVGIWAMPFFGGWKDENGVTFKLRRAGLKFPAGTTFHVGDTITQEVVRRVTPTGKLMPSAYRVDEKNRFLPALNETYRKLDSEGYYEFDNIFDLESPKDYIKTFEDIKPTMKGLTYGRRRVDVIDAVHYPDGFNTQQLADNGTDYKYDHFFIRLRPLGFNLFDCVMEQDMMMNITSGSCAACKLPIRVSKANENLVKVDENGNLVLNELGDVDNADIAIDSQNDTTDNYVWIKVGIDTSTFGSEKTDNGAYPSEFVRVKEGDSFVFSNIYLPFAFIDNAEKRLDAALLDFMYENNREKFQFAVNFSRVFLAQNPKIKGMLSELSSFTVEADEKIYEPLYANSFTYKQSEGEPLPEIGVTISTLVEVTGSVLDRKISQILGDVSLGLVGATPKPSDGMYVTKDEYGNVDEVITFLHGARFGTNVQLGKNGRGAAFLVDDSGRTSLEVDNLSVRGLMTISQLEIEKIKSVGGKILVSLANMTVSYAELLSDGYVSNVDGAAYVQVGPVFRCYFNTTAADGGALTNDFDVNDVIISKSYAGGIAQKEYAGVVKATGPDYCDIEIRVGNGWVPAAGDVIVQCGNIGDELDAMRRQSAIELSCYGADSPRLTMYAGINECRLDFDKFISFSISYQKRHVVNEFEDADGSIVRDEFDVYESKLLNYGSLYSGTKDRSAYIEFDAIKQEFVVKARLIAKTPGEAEIEVAERAIKEVITLYALGLSKTGAPDDDAFTTEYPAEIPAGMYLWYRLKVIHFDDSFTLDVPNCLSAIDGVGVFKSIVFIRQNEKPDTPEGGSYAEPVPEGWSDGVPAGDNILWMSTRVFTSSGAAPQQDEWTEPTQATDTANLDVEFSSELAPFAPEGHPNTNLQWSNKADENTIWMAISRYKNGVWGDWEVSKIKGEKGDAGSAGSASFKSIVFKRSNSAVSAPQGGSYTDPTPEGWSDGVPEGEEQLWMSTRIFTSDGEAPQTDKWTDPQPASDTADIDFEYSNVELNPQNPTSAPDNWRNDAAEGDVWMAVRKIRNGVPQKWQISRIKGEKGATGNTPYLQDGTWWIGDTDTGVRAEGKDGDNGLTPTVGDNGHWFVGTTDTGVPATGATGVGISSVDEYYGVSTDKDKQPIKWEKETIPTDYNATNKYLWNYEVTNYTDGSSTPTTPCIIGVWGKDGENGRGIKGITEHYGISKDATTLPTSWSDTFVAPTTDEPIIWNYETITYTDETTEDLPAAIVGSKGEQGIPGIQGVPGEPGKDGVVLYTWIRYADSATGEGMSNDPANKEYIGFAYNKEEQKESDNPADYTWSHIRGEQGQPGGAGYTWIAYSDNANGVPMYQLPNDNTKYIGIAVNQHDEKESTDPSVYTWSKFRGEKGESGASIKVQFSANGTNWHDTFQSNDLYMRQRVGDADWSNAMRIVGEKGDPGADGSYRTFVFTESPTQPATPSAGVLSPTSWTDSPASYETINPWYTNGSWTANGRTLVSNAIGHGEATWQRVNFTTTKANQKILVEIQASSEANCDFGYIGKLDTNYSTSNFLKRVSGTQVEFAEIAIATAGTHYFWVGYTKDYSAVSNADCVFVRIMSPKIWMTSTLVVNGKAGAWTAPIMLNSESVDGLNGRDGQDGQDGQPGERGPEGPQGPQGPGGGKGDKGDAGRSVVNTLPVYYLKNSITAPSAPTSNVTSTSTSANVWTTARPGWQSGYYLYTCTQTNYDDNTYSWSTVTRIILDYDYLVEKLPKTDIVTNGGLLLGSFLGVTNATTGNAAGGTVVAGMNGATGTDFVDSTKGKLLMFAGRNSESTAYKDALYKVWSSGKLEAKDADIEGKITSSEGKIGGFQIDDHSLSGTGVFLTNAKGSVAPSVVVQKQEGSIELGAISNQSNEIMLSKIALTGGGGTTGVALDVSASGYSSGNNYAIRASMGMFAGLRPKVSSLTTGTILDEYDHTVYVNNNSTAIITLPSNPQDGQTYQIIHGSTTSMTIRTQDSKNIVRISTNNATTATSHTSTSKECAFITFIAALNQWILVWLGK